MLHQHSASIYSVACFSRCGEVWLAYSDSDSDLEGAEHFDTQSSDAVSMPHCSFNPCEQLLKEVASLANPLSQCCSYGRSIYLAAIRVCGNHLTHDCDDCTQVE